MNYEQRYKKALERAKDMMSYKEVRREDLEYLFPELKESEDERIRRAILEHIQLCSESIPDRDKWIAWLEKQGKQSSNILWHDVSEEPEARGEIFCEWKSSTSTWHSVVFYHADSKAFLEGERIVKNVVKWAYVDEIVEKQGEQKHSWSEEDELMLKDAIEFIETGWSDKGKSHLVYWLKSLKQRIGE